MKDQRYGDIAKIVAGNAIRDLEPVQDNVYQHADLLMHYRAGLAHVLAQQATGETIDPGRVVAVTPSDEVPGEWRDRATTFRDEKMRWLRDLPTGCAAFVAYCRRIVLGELEAAA